MVRLFFIFLFLSGQFSYGQAIPVIKYPQLEAMMAPVNNEIHVFNFWATWCAPCVKELPYFEKLNSRQLPGVRVTLISLDFADKVARVETFAQKKKMTSEIVLLDEIDYNTWIDKVDPAWSGAIPATLIINHRTGKRKFVEGELKEGDLELIISEIQKP